MAYSAISTKVSNYLAKELQHSEGKKEIIAYAVENIINTVLGFILIIVLGFLLKAPIETFWAAIAGGLLRKLSGGFHFSTPARCIVTGAVTYSLMGWLAKYFFALYGDSKYFVMTLFAIGVICLVLVIIYAPVDSKAKPIVSKHFRRKLRIFSIICAVCFGVIAFFNKGSGMTPAVIGGLLIQSLSLLPVLNKE